MAMPWGSSMQHTGIMVAQSGCSSGFEPGLVLEFFVSQPVGRGFEPPVRHTFFYNNRVAENIPVLSLV